MASIFEKFTKQNTTQNTHKPKTFSAEEVISEVKLELPETVAKPFRGPASKVNRTRNETMNLRFSPEELEEINDKISLSGLSKTDFILMCVREHPVIVIPELSEAMTEFRKQGVNLNQIAKSLNEYSAGLNRYGVRIYNENSTWRGITTELEDLRKENVRTQILLKKILEKLEQTARKG